MSESLDVVGLECEEAMFYIRDVLRKGVMACPGSAPQPAPQFHPTAGVCGQARQTISCTPAIKPGAGRSGELTVSKVMPC